MRKLGFIIGIIMLLIALMPLSMPVSDNLSVQAAGPLQAAPPNPDFVEFQQNGSEPFYGYIPPPVDLSHLDRIPVERARGLATLPSSFDWRDEGKVTAVKDQKSCGTCWVFGTTSVLESAVLMGEDTEYNFSEQSVALCVDRSWVYLYDHADEPCGSVPGHGGGWSWLASEVFIKKGAVLESCNPYDGSGLQCDGSCTCDSCTPVKKVNGYRYVTGDQSQTGLIKDAVYNHGPVTMAFYYGNSHKYTHATYGTVYDCASCSDANHLVSIIGWDDNVPHFETSGTGAWLVKNSWGTGWGNSGYFWLAYDSSCMTEIAYLEYEDYDPNETLYYWDEAGWVNDIGYLGESAWMASIFSAGQNGTLTNVEFWTTSNNAQYQIYVYRDGNIADGLQNLAASQNGTCEELGYYSVPLDSPVLLTNGEAFTVAVKMTTPGYGYPIAAEGWWDGMCDPPIQSNVSFVREGDSDSWEDAAPYGWNVCLRGVVTPPTLVHNLNTGESFSTIQAAIDAANTTNGHTITVDAGTYNENVNVDKRLTIRSTSGNPADTIVSATNSSDYVFAVTANWVNITGFTVENATGGGNAGIWLGDSAQHCNISSNNVTNNCHGIVIDYSSNNTLTGNIASSNTGSGIYIKYSSGNNVTGNSVSNNPWGIELDSSSNDTIYNNYFNNTNNAYDNRNSTWNTTNTTGPNIAGGPYIGGNYWSDYTGNDTDGDGFGETPYNITGDSNKDYLPLVILTGATLEGHVSFSGRTNNTQWIEPFVVRFFQGGSEMAWSPINATTNNTGVFTLPGIDPGTYNVSIKNWTCLSEVVTGVTLTAGNTTVVNFGTTREGDCDNNDHINILDASFLASRFGSGEGDPGWSPLCDFNRDTHISILDASALASNFGQGGDLVS